MTKLIRIRFTRGPIVYHKHGYPNHPDNPVYEKGRVESLREDLARRWLNRGVAEVIDDSKSKPEADDGNDAQAKAGPSASKADGDDAGKRDVADKRGSRKAVSRNN